MLINKLKSIETIVCYIDTLNYMLNYALNVYRYTTQRQKRTDNGDNVCAKKKKENNTNDLLYVLR